MLRFYAMKLDSKGYNRKVKIKARNKVRHVPGGLNSSVSRIRAGMCTKLRWRIRDEGERKFYGAEQCGAVRGG